MQLPWALALSSPLVYQIFWRFQPANLGVLLDSVITNKLLSRTGRMWGYSKIQQKACVRQGRRELFTMVIQKGRRWWVRLWLQACKRSSQGIRRKGRSTFHWGRVLCLNHSKSFAIQWHSFCHDYMQRLPTTLLPSGRSYMDECDMRMSWYTFSHNTDTAFSMIFDHGTSKSHLEISRIYANFWTNTCCSTGTCSLPCIVISAVCTSWSFYNVVYHNRYPLASIGEHINPLWTECSSVSPPISASYQNTTLCFRRPIRQNSLTLKLSRCSTVIAASSHM